MSDDIRGYLNILNESTDLNSASEEELLNEGKWNEEILKNLIRATIAGFIAYGGLEAKRLSTPLDTQRLDALFQQLEKEDQLKLKKTIKTLSHDERRGMNTVGKNIKRTGKIPEQDKVWLQRIIDRSITN